MIFAQFYHYGVESHSLIEACGDRSVVILDARRCYSSHFADARMECAKRNFDAWELRKGNSFSDAKPISPIVKVSKS